METYLAALDQGTTSSRAILFNTAGEIVSRGQHPFRQIYPQPGWVEHDPMEIWATERQSMAEAVDAAHIDPKCIAAIGITNQRETTVVWDARMGEPVTEKTGLLLDAYFSGTKLRWLLDTVPGLRRRAEAGELRCGTVDSWLIWNLTGGKAGWSMIRWRSGRRSAGPWRRQWMPPISTPGRSPASASRTSGRPRSSGTAGRGSRCITPSSGSAAGRPPSAMG